jgi:hypothetical protein
MAWERARGRRTTSIRDRGLEDEHVQSARDMKRKLSNKLGFQTCSYWVGPQGFQEQLDNELYYCIFAITDADVIECVTLLMKS